MKFGIYTSLLAVMLMSFLLFTSCDSDTPSPNIPTTEQRQTTAEFHTETSDISTDIITTDAITEDTPPVSSQRYT